MITRISKYLKPAISVILLVYIFYFIVDIRKFIEVLSGAQVGYIAVSALFLCSSLFVSSYRWQVVIKIKDLKMRYFVALKEYFIGTFFNNFLPGSIGGDISRIVGAAKETGSKEVALSSVFIERVVGLISLLLIGLSGSFFLDITSGTGFVSISIILLASIILVLILTINKRSNKIILSLIEQYFPQKLGEIAKNYLSDFSQYSDSYVKLFYVLLISFSFKIFDGFFVYFIFQSLNIGLSYAHAIVIFASISIIKMIPISFNGLGLSAVSWVFILKSFNINEETAASVDLLIIMNTLIVSSVGGILYFLRKE